MQPQSDVALAPWCTLGVGGPARHFVHATDESAVIEGLRWAEAHRLPTHILGGGSNVVFADEGFAGVVVRVEIGGTTSSPAGARRHFTVGAGESWDGFVARTIAAECAGLECLSGIPGTAGGTPVQNVGAYGQDVSAVITHVHVVDRQTWSPRTFRNEECRFGYRTSRFKREDAERFVVTRVDFELPHGARPTIAYADVVAHFEREGNDAPSLDEARNAVLNIRRRKGMVIEPDNPANRSVGSFFVNPVITEDHFARLAAATGAIPHYAQGGGRVKVPAAWLIETAGFARGTRRGRAGVSPFQAQAILNLGGASAGDVVALATEIKRAVWKAFDIALVPEPVFVGFADSPEQRWLLGK
jgi:UDP-N-acetylmuramate dehydrogenase